MMVLRNDLEKSPSVRTSLSSGARTPVEILPREAAVGFDATGAGGKQGEDLVAAQDHDSSLPSPPPNGGWYAWLQVTGSFFLFVNSWGNVNAFGVFQTYYENNPDWTASSSTISWIGSTQAFLLLIIGVISGPLYDKGYFRHLITVGACLVPFGLMMTSICTQYWQVMLAQGIVVGLGNGCLFVPSVAILPQYFSTKKALANGLAASGSSVGGIIYPIMFRKLQVQLGFGWATRILGFVSLITLAFSVLVMRPRVLPQTKRPLTQMSAFKEAPYNFFTAGMFFVFIGFYGPLYYIQTFAIDRGITDGNLGFYLLPILNAASVPGRILPNFVSDYTGPLNVMVPASLLTAALAFTWIAVHNTGGLIAFAIAYGFCSGAFVSLPPVGMVALTKDMNFIGTRMGQMFFLSSFGLLVGAPVSGAIYTSTGSFLGLQIFSGAVIMATAALMLAARVSAVGWKLKRKI